MPPWPRGPVRYGYGPAVVSRARRRAGVDKCAFRAVLVRCHGMGRQMLLIIPGRASSQALYAIGTL
ncbi:hypothetical protein SBRY_30764 [Actinacidiphila bryophytorum]|uniref:Uncharacterized protein n=1 Tax=Actinacidiphila bryophytorum TaxID=1436133 RepID=A0A9W4H1S8_9ACTN|nr:hypothetical protein SBRY_30764 [Actinacidiphila bryophytorum]